MQIKKDEIRQEILLAAENEFYKRGYRRCFNAYHCQKKPTPLLVIFIIIFEIKKPFSTGDQRYSEKINAMIEKHREFL